MGTTRIDPRRRVRRIVSAALAGLLAVGGGAILVVSGAVGPANAAPGDVFFTTPEYTPITNTLFQFDGEATAGDAITITSSHGNDCHAITNGVGVWQCDMTFTSSTDVTVITVSRDVDDGNPGTQESDGQEHHIALPVAINETSPGQILTTGASPVTGSGAWPTATMIVTIDGLPCPGPPANVSGNWSCTPPFLADGPHLLEAQQDVGAAVSDVSSTSYVVDTTTFIPYFNAPFDSHLPAAGTQTSDRTPTVGGAAGDAEPFGTVTVYTGDHVAPVVHPAADPGTFYCSDVADGTGAWSCSGATLIVGHYYVFGATQVDAVGNTTGSPDAEFDVEILPPPAAPIVNTPTPGQEGLPPFTIDATVDGVTTEVTVQQGGFPVAPCGTLIPVANNVNCNPALGPGPHALDITAYDVYETGTTTSVSVNVWGPPVLDTPVLAYMTSESTVRLSGDAPVGADLSVRVDGAPVAACSGIVTGIPEFDCMSNFVGVGAHNVDVDFEDPSLNVSPTVSRLFTIVATLPAPVFVEPLIGYSSKNKVVHVEMTNAPEGTVYVREGAFDLCPPTPIAVGTFSCDTSPLSVGVHTIRISQTDQYGVMSASAIRQVTILPTPFLPLTMKTFGFSFRVLGPDGAEVGTDGLDTGDDVTIETTGVPPGTLIQTEIHSTPVMLGSQTVGQSGQTSLTTVVPPVPPGSHEIVVSASAPGYWPTALSVPVVVHGLKQMPETEDAAQIKQLGEPDDVKQLGETADDSGSGPGGPGSGGYGFDEPTVFGSSVESPFDAEAQAFQLTVAGVALTGSLGIAFLLMVGLPAELLESTIRSNYDRAFGWMARIRRRIAKIAAPVARVLSNPWIGSGLTILAASILLGFADPGYGFNGASVRLTIAMLLAILAINVGLTAIVMRVARRAFDVGAMLQPMPAALALVGISVLVSRLAGISPGFLFGIVLGVVYARELRLRDEGRLGALGVGLTLGAGLLAWLGYGIASTASGPGFWNNLAIETFAAITLEALGTLVIALLPIDFLDGRTIFRWSKPAWIGLYLATALVFLFVVVPMSGNWGTMSAPIFGWGTLFVVFGVVAIATWALFRRFPRERDSDEAATPSSRRGAAAPPRSRR